jgi:hypothetical protein
MRLALLADRRRLRLGLFLGFVLLSAGCGAGGGSSGGTDPKRGEEIKQKKLDSMKEIMQKKLSGKRSH